MLEEPKYNKVEVRFAYQITLRMSDEQVEVMLLTPSMKKSECLIALPAAYFDDEAQTRKWFQAALGKFEKLLQCLWEDETKMMMIEVLNASMITSHLPALPFREMIEETLRQRRDVLNERYEVQKAARKSRAGRPSPWTRFELTRAISRVLQTIPNAKRPTLALINKRLHDLDSKRAPKNSEALRQLLRRLNVDLDELKSGVTPRRSKLRG